MSEALPSVFIPHGGGPCFFMDWTLGPADSWDSLARWLRGYAAGLPRRPSAVLVVSAHWEEDGFAVQSGEQPPLLFDYHGFPPHTYELQYPALGAPDLARRVAGLLHEAGLPCREDPDRPYDHGVFVPLLLMFPAADIPVLQLSLDRSLDPAMHLAAGQALSALGAEGVLVVGSGMSFHNLPLFLGRQGSAVSAAFDQWLSGLVDLSPQGRGEALVQWRDAPRAGEAHPREEHLLPLMVAAGAGGGMTRVFHDLVHGHALSAFEFAAAS